jgi:hypothetical protein
MNQIAEGTILDVRFGRRVVLLPGSFVDFFAGECCDFSEITHQGVIEEISSSGDITIRCTDGTIYKNLKIERISISK